MWIAEGLLFGFLLGIAVYGLVLLFLAITSKLDDKHLTVISFIPAIIVFAIFTINGVIMQTKDISVDFYDDNGQIVETYEITYYSRKMYGDGTTFYLKDGRTIVRKDCIYNIRFEEED